MAVAQDEEPWLLREGEEAAGGAGEEDEDYLLPYEDDDDDEAEEELDGGLHGAGTDAGAATTSASALAGSGTRHSQLELGLGGTEAGQAVSKGSAEALRLGLGDDDYDGDYEMLDDSGDEGAERAAAAEDGQSRGAGGLLKPELVERATQAGSATSLQQHPALVQGAGGVAANTGMSAVGALRAQQRAQQQQQLLHRHHLSGHPSDHSAVMSGFVGFMVAVLVVAHVIALLVWLRAWWRQRRTKGAALRAPTPPAKLACTYDMDKPVFAMPKIELAQLSKALKPQQA